MGTGGADQRERRGLPGARGRPSCPSPSPYCPAAPPPPFQAAPPTVLSWGTGRASPTQALLAHQRFERLPAVSSQRLAVPAAGTVGAPCVRAGAAPAAHPHGSHVPALGAHMALGPRGPSRPPGPSSLWRGAASRGGPSETPRLGDGRAPSAWGRVHGVVPANPVVSISRPSWSTAEDQAVDRAVAATPLTGHQGQWAVGFQGLGDWLRFSGCRYSHGDSGGCDLVRGVFPDVPTICRRGGKGPSQSSAQVGVGASLSVGRPRHLCIHLPHFGIKGWGARNVCGCLGPGLKTRQQPQLFGGAL